MGFLLSLSNHLRILASRGGSPLAEIIMEKVKTMIQKTVFTEVGTP